MHRRGKKIKGRKRHIATDVLGLLLTVIVTAASVQDSAAGQQVLDQIAIEHPHVSTAWVDGGYNNAVVNHGSLLGIQVDVVKRLYRAKSRCVGGDQVFRRSGQATRRYSLITPSRTFRCVISELFRVTVRNAA